MILNTVYGQTVIKNFKNRAKMLNNSFAFGKWKSSSAKARAAGRRGLAARLFSNYRLRQIAMLGKVSNILFSILRFET